MLCEERSFKKKREERSQKLSDYEKKLSLPSYEERSKKHSECGKISFRVRFRRKEAFESSKKTGLKSLCIRRKKQKQANEEIS